MKKGEESSKEKKKKLIKFPKETKKKATEFPGETKKRLTEFSEEIKEKPTEFSEETKEKTTVFSEKTKKKFNVFSENKKKANRKKIIIIIVAVIITVVCATVAILYQTNAEIRDFMDQYIFRKNVIEENLPMIEIDYNSNTNVIPYGRYICILAENTLFQYNSSGRQEREVKVEISNPVYDVEGQYLVIGEKNNQKLYLLSGNHIVWEQNVDGNLNKVTVNQNGYVSAIVTGTTYKSVIITYDNEGNELFKSYLSSVIAVDACISPDNQDLAYAEVTTSGTAVQSTIKVISIEEVTETETKAKYTYEAPQNSLLLRIKYQNRNQLICIYDDRIDCIENNEVKQLYSLNEENQKITFADIELDNYVFRTVEQSTGLFSANTVVEMKSIGNERENIYTIEEVAKSVVSNENVIAVNLGTQVEFINTNGWLIKRYISTQVIRNIVIADGVAGIIYRDKIELVSL